MYFSRIVTGTSAAGSRTRQLRRLAGALLAAALLATLPALAGDSVEDSLRRIAASPDHVRLVPGPGLAIDLRYATERNFVGVNLYGPFRDAYLHRIAAAKLARAAEALRREHPGYKLLVWDALRPRSVQWRLWDKVRGTPERRYVADPARGSVHNYGFAVDLTVLDAAGHELDMGTPFDDFTPRAQPRREAQLLLEGQLTAAQVRNRRVLRDAMEAGGFRQLPIEWWHFDALPPAQVRAQYRIVE